MKRVGKGAGLVVALATAGLALAACGGGTSQSVAFAPEQYVAFGDEASAIRADGRRYTVNPVNLLGGAIVVEQVFAIPGLGRLILGAIAERNYPLLQATILMVTLGFVVVNFVVDLLYLAIDPRVRA